MHVAAETRSFQRAATLLQRTLGAVISAKSVERLAGDVGEELRQRQESPTSAKEVTAPAVAVVSCDGGRIHTREAGQGPGVHGAKWRETKNASFERMAPTKTVDADPCPELPETFRQVAHVAKIAEKAAFQAEAAPEDRPIYEGPKLLLRTCLSSMVNSDEFGPQMKREATRRRFFEAARRVFISDGLPWNWSIWSAHFSMFTPILDFIHAVKYLYAAALAWEADDESRWARYLQLAEACWQGRAAELVEQLLAELAARGVAPGEALPEGSPHQPLADAARYFHNNAERMNYPCYRREGLPITSAPMEALIKQINFRVKGTEMFCNDPDGAEAILQLRSASLSEDSRLDDYLKTRPGSAYVRRTTLETAA